MATYAVADVHGDFAALQRLERKIGWKAGADRVIMLGDLVGRGSQSKAALQWACERDDWVTTLLGNHDFALLMAHAGLRETRDEGLHEILDSSQGDDLCAWLRSQPLLIEDCGYALVHAGILPTWDLLRAREHARAIEQAVQGADYVGALRALWGTDQRCEDPSAKPQDQLQLAANSFARMRMCDEDGCIELSYSGKPAAGDNGLHPWYSHPKRKPIGMSVIFGHWSGHGMMISEDAIMLDAGASYGGPLCAWEMEAKRLHSA